MRFNIGQINDLQIEEIKKATLAREPIEFFSNTLTHEIEENFQKVLIIFLQACDQSHLFNFLSYSTLELLSNANKANAKRIYFKENKLNITNDKDYSSGMENFKAALTGNKIHYMNELETSFLQINLYLSNEGIITVSVSNNTKITAPEYQRIQDKINIAKKYTSMDQALSCVDQTEGSGLGIIIIILMLKELGLDENHLIFKTTDTETIASIEIPVDTFEEL